MESSPTLEHVLGYKRGLNKVKIYIIHNIFSDQKGMKLRLLIERKQENLQLCGN